MRERVLKVRLEAPTVDGRKLRMAALYTYDGRFRRLRIVQEPPRLARWRALCRRPVGNDRMLRITVRCSVEAAAQLALEEVVSCGWPSASIELYPLPASTELDRVG